MDKEKLKKLSYNLTTNKDNFIESFRRNIYMYLKEKDVTLKEICEHSGVPYSTLNNLLYGNQRDFKVSTAIALARTFGVSIDELIGAEVLDSLTRERLAICRTLPKHSLYLVQWFIREQKRLNEEFSPKKGKVVSVMQPLYVNGRLNPTNVFEPLNIDILSDNVKSKVFMGIRITCEDYMPHYSPYDTLLLANDRETRVQERCIILYYGKILIVTKTERIENDKKIIEYIGIRDKNIIIKKQDLDTIIGYVVCTYNL